MRQRFRSVFISDSHLGSSAACAEELSYFLKHIECDALYLVGDVLDMWRLKRRWYWPKSHNDVVRRLLKLSSKGTRIIYIPGNHDDSARQYAGLAFGGVEIALNTVHVTADRKRVLVTHGDQYDLVVQHSRLLSKIGGTTYEMLLALNRLWNRGRGLFGLPQTSLAQAIKSRVKSACTFVSRFEDELIAEARRGQFDAVVCGHIHKAEQRELASGIAYYNCGDWVESCTALVEHDDGRFELLKGVEFNADMRRRDEQVEDDDVDPWLVAPPFPTPFDPRAARRSA